MLLCVLLFIYSVAKGQFNKPTEVTVRMGEALPESFYQTVHQAVDTQTGEDATVNFADHSDKLIILDFWASWCGPCLHSLNKMDTISKKMQDERYIIIPVTYQSKKEASKAYEKYRWPFTSIVADTTLNKIFPHTGLPHMVWIKDGKVIALPRTQFVTYESILTTINGRMPVIPMMKYDINPAMPIYGQKEGIYSGSVLSTSELASGDPDFQQQRLVSIRENNMLIVTGINLPLFEVLLPEAFRSSTNARRYRVVFEVDSAVKATLTAPRPLINQYKNLDDYSCAYNEWVRTFRYSYRIAIADTLGEEALYKAMQDDLRRFIKQRFGLVVHCEDYQNSTVLKIKELNK